MIDLQKKKKMQSHAVTMQNRKWQGEKKNIDKIDYYHKWNDIAIFVFFFISQC